MTYPSGGPGYPGAQQPGAQTPTTQLPAVDAGPSKLPVYLLVGVAILGLAAYLLNFGPIWKGDAGAGATVTLGVIAALFAGLFAVVGLLPKQSKYTGVITVIAVVGFLLTIYDLISHAKVAGWALIVIVVVAALQTVLAIAALLLDAGVISPPAPRPRYDPYQQYGGYYMQPGQQPQFIQPQGVPQQAGAATQSFSQPQGFPPYGVPGGPSTGPFPAAQPAGAPTGFAGGPAGGGFPPHGHASGPPTPPTGFPTYAPPPSQPAGQDQQPPVPSHDQPTQEVRLEPKPSESPASPPA
ncbi:MAG: hypothetical protein QOH60_425 [Mycobacterium sp.]|jgi:hypothetical protein|nr:hypothetical protein [Mycobacterium sp.]